MPRQALRDVFTCRLSRIMEALLTTLLSPSCLHCKHAENQSRGAKEGDRKNCVHCVIPMSVLPVTGFDFLSAATFTAPVAADGWSVRAPPRTPLPALGGGGGGQPTPAPTLPSRACRRTGGRQPTARLSAAALEPAGAVQRQCRQRPHAAASLSGLGCQQAGSFPPPSLTPSREATSQRAPLWGGGPRAHPSARASAPRRAVLSPAPSGRSAGRIGAARGAQFQTAAVRGCPQLLYHVLQPRARGSARALERLTRDGGGGGGSRETGPRRGGGPLYGHPAVGPPCCRGCGRAPPGFRHALSARR